ncbi:MAG TPA: deoxyribodipyrimidine photo-lyase, partial [bacterium]|nr:deoxyribodipyrimidine photo-lyase [bacterium]
FRNDLRLDDNPALEAAAQRGAVLPVYIWAPREEGAWPPGAASRWWLHQSLLAFGKDLKKKSLSLVLRIGPTLPQLRDLLVETGADAVYWNRRYEPAGRERDEKIQRALRAEGFAAESFQASLLFEPWEIKTQGGGPYQVFTPFWRACLAKPEPDPPIPKRRRLQGSSVELASLSLEYLKLEPEYEWAKGIAKAWRPGEAGAVRELGRFLDQAIERYPKDRDRPALTGTSRLSPHLHFGEISPRRIWHELRSHSAAVYLKELGWREFAHHLLFHFPQTPQDPLRRDFERFPWRSDARALKAWQRGKTGYPLVDAGMRELWRTGWMHNRVRMIVASFLVKDLLLPWQEGARWFWDTLVDADLANNTLGWQWSAGCGADAAPYFRVFNPLSQGEKFDPGGRYLRKWLPELAKLPDRWIHRPFAAPAEVLAKAGIELGRTYPFPLVDHGDARAFALRAFHAMKKLA